MWNMVRCPRTCGYQPVMKEQRLGVQTGFWQKAWRKDTASASMIASRLGVTAAGLPRWPYDIAAPLVGIKDDDVGLLGHA